jgi:hypothetical protein
MKRMISISIVLAATLAACSTAGNGGTGGGEGPDAGNRGGGDAQGSGSGTHDAASGVARKTIFTILLENHDYAEIVGSTNAPYINSLIAQGALATNYKDTNHPSTPNYLHLISGADQYPGVIDIGPNQWPYFPAAQPNLGTQLETASLKWRSYQESMGTPCTLTDSSSFVTRHDPFLYFTDMQMATPCDERNVDYSSFAADLATSSYDYMWITPNLTDDGHDPQLDPVTGLTQTDSWLSANVPAILNSASFKAGGILFITWDEAEGRNGDDPDKIPMIILSPRVKQAGMTSATAYTHSSYLATVEDLLSLPRLATVSTEPNMTEFLNP